MSKDIRDMKYWIYNDVVLHLLVTDDAQPLSCVKVISIMKEEAEKRRVAYLKEIEENKKKAAQKKIADASKKKERLEKQLRKIQQELGGAE